MIAAQDLAARRVIELLREEEYSANEAIGGWDAYCPICDPDSAICFHVSPNGVVGACQSGTHEPGDIVEALRLRYRNEPGADDDDETPVAAIAHGPHLVSEDAVSFFASCDQQIDWILEPYVFRGGITLIQGPPKGGKTWLAAWIYTESWKRNRRVLFVEEEGAREVLRDRLMPFLRDKRELEESRERLRILFRKGFRLDDARTVASIVEDIRRNRTELVVLDPLMLLHSKGENKADEMGVVLAALVRIVNETGCGIALIHHTKKGDSWSKTSDAEAQSSDSRGSGAVVGAVDIIIQAKGLPASKRVEGQVSVIVENPDSRVGAPFTKRELVIDMASGSVSEFDRGPRTEEEKAEDLHARMLAVIPAAPGSISRSALRDALRVKKSDLLRAAQELIERGAIADLGHLGVQRVNRERFPVPENHGNRGNREPAETRERFPRGSFRNRGNREPIGELSPDRSGTDLADQIGLRTSDHNDQKGSDGGQEGSE